MTLLIALNICLFGFGIALNICLIIFLIKLNELQRICKELKGGGKWNQKQIILQKEQTSSRLN